MAEQGNPASLSDVGVGLLATRACIDGAALNVRINLGSLKEEKIKTELMKRTEMVRNQSNNRFSEIDEIVEKKLA